MSKTRTYKELTIDTTKEVISFPEEDSNYKQKEEKNEYSITPDTFYARALLTSGNEATGRFVERYTHSGNEVLRFGISASAVTEEEVSKNPSMYTKTGKSQISGTNKSLSESDKLVNHHPLEIDSLKDAITHLLATGNTRTVLVDILERVADGNREIKLTSKGEKDGEYTVQTHSVLLYKNPAKSKTLEKNGTHEIVVIDPSNIEFSSHLSSTKLQEKLRDMPSNFDKILTPSGKLQIYKPAQKGVVGPEISHYRDCIDIAVKLAFGLNKEELTFSIAQSQQVEQSPSTSESKNNLAANYIKTLSVIKQISNDSTIDTTIIVADIKSKTSDRIKQASDTEISKKFYQLQVGLDTLQKTAKVIFGEEEATKFLKNYSHIVNREVQYRPEIIKQLFSLHEGENKKICPL